MGGAGAFAAGVISHISSQPAVVLPVRRFCAALPGVPVVVCPGVAMAPRARTVDVTGAPGTSVNGLRFGLSVLLDTAWYLGS